MALRVEVSVVVERPLSEVFDFYARDHVRNHPRWDPDIEFERASEGSVGIGTIIRRRNSHSGTPVEGTMEVVEFEPNRAFGVVIREGPSETHGRVTFGEESEDQTLLTIGAHMLDLDESLRESMTSLMQRSAGNIKALIESEA